MPNFTHTVLRKFIISVILLFTCTQCYKMDDARRLLSVKLQNYDKNFRPMVEQSKTLTLYTAFELVSIQEFDEVQERLTVMTVIYMSWVDEYMKWNQSEYGDTDQLLVESDNVWTPNLVLSNNINKLEKIGDSWHTVRFLPSGTALYYPADVLSASCSVDVRFYPWDRHKCSFSFSVWAHYPSEIQFRATKDKVQTQFFSGNGAWTLLESDVKTTHDNAFLDFVLYLERKPQFVLVNVITPIILMAYLNAVIFLIPGESGERVSCSITVLLALAVFLTLVGDNLPKTSSPMSFFSYYLLVQLVINICMTLAMVFSTRLFYKDTSEPVPSCLNIFGKYCCWKGKNKRKQKYLKTDSERNGQLKENCTQDQLLFVTNLNNPVNSRYTAFLKSKSHRCVQGKNEGDGTRNIREATYRTQVHDGEDTTGKVSWKDVSVAFDKMCFILSVVALTIATVIFFVKISVGS